MAWKRIDDTFSGILRTGTWNYETNASHYNGGAYASTDPTSKLSLIFYGTQFRIIAGYYTNKRTDNIISIDGVSTTFNQYGALQYQAILYEKTGLTLGFHTVIIASPNLTGSQNYQIDAVEIDSTGFILPNFYGIYCIKDNGQYYSFNSAKYDTTTKKYHTITTTDIYTENSNALDSLTNLTTSTTLGGETFRPIDKFTNPQLITFNSKNLSINGIKSTSELVICKKNISNLQAQIITKYFLDKTVSGSGDIKLVISNDNMTTWKTWNGSSWTNLTNTVIDKDYISMSVSEKTQWNTFKNEIISVGMTDTVLQSADFSSFLGQNLRFAFVLIRPSYSDVSTLKDMQWTYTGKDNYVLLNNTDIKVSLNENYIKLTPTRNISKVKVNVLT